MKTPEEIKKGLEACRAFECHGQHTSCPYVDDKLCMMHICGDALTMIEHLDAKVPKWISVEERLPEKNGIYLAHVVHRYCKIDSYWRVCIEYFGKEGTWDSLADIYEVTHWMPLPELPKEDENEAE